MDPKIIINEFVSFLKSKGRTSSTVIAYQKDIDQLLQFLLGEKKIKTLQDINTDLLNSFVAYLEGTNKFTLKTISRKINSLKTFCKFLIDAGKIHANPAATIKHPKLVATLPRILTQMEYRALRDSARANVRIYTMIEILLQTGVRIGELSRLKRTDVKIENGKYSINIAPFSSLAGRKVELNSIAVNAMQNYLARIPSNPKGEDYLFYTKTGKPVLIRNIRSAINRLFEKAGVKNATVNDIRNTYIVFQLQNGIKVDTLAQVVGHKNTATTEKYMALIPNKPKRKATKLLEL